MVRGVRVGERGCVKGGCDGEGRRERMCQGRGVTVRGVRVVRCAGERGEVSVCLFHCYRTFYMFEAAWDSSLHNSVLLNRSIPLQYRTAHISPPKHQFTPLHT